MFDEKNFQPKKTVGDRDDLTRCDTLVTVMLEAKQTYNDVYSSAILWMKNDFQEHFALISQNRKP